MAKKPETKVTVSIRISPELVKAFQDFVLDFNTAYFTRGGGVGVPELIGEAAAMRAALEQGLALMRKNLPAKKGGRR